jgi:LmbE family N-acetylglucosaminyl deacetylase
VRVLAIGAHPDDVELAAGATLARHVLGGDDVVILTLTSGVMARGDAVEADVVELRSHAMDAAQVIGADLRMLNYPDQRLDTVDRLTLTKAVEGVIETMRPDAVYTHSAADRNLDHRITHDVVLTACRPLPGFSVRAVYAFEVPSSSEWGGRAFAPTVFVDVSGDAMQIKHRALACYRGEMCEFPHPRSVGGLSSLASWRGATAGVPAAEAFELVREIR